MLSPTRRVHIVEWDRDTSDPDVMPQSVAVVDAPVLLGSAAAVTGVPLEQCYLQSVPMVDQAWEAVWLELERKRALAERLTSSMTRAWLEAMSRRLSGPDGYEARQLLNALAEYDRRRAEEG